MNIDQLIQLGGTASTLAVLIWMVRYFITAVGKKDIQIEKLHEDFLLIIGNHMKHEEKAFEQLTDSIKRLADKK